MNIEKKWKVYGFLAVLPSIILIAIFVYFFIGNSIFVSLSDLGGGEAFKKNPVINFVGMENYKNLFQGFINARFRQDLVNAFFYTLFLVTGAIVTGLGLAMLLDHSPKGESVIRTIFLYPMALSFIVSGTIWRWLLAPSGGINLFPEIFGLPKSEFLWVSSRETVLQFNWQNLPVIIIVPLLIFFAVSLFKIVKKTKKNIFLKNKKFIVFSVLSFLGLIYIFIIHNFVKILPFEETHGFNLATTGILMAGIWQYSGYTMAIFLAGFRGIPESVYEAARIDGAGELRYYFQIAIPLIRPITLSAVIILSHISLKMFALIYAMAGADNANTDHPSILMYLTTFRGNNFSTGAAISVVLFFLVAVFIIPYLVSSYRKRSR